MKPGISIIDGGDGAPAEPDWSAVYSDVLDVEAASREWGLVVREMRDAGTLAAVNGHAIKRLVEFRVQYERAAKHVAEIGAIRPAKRAKTGQWNPYWTVMRQADEAIRAIEAELGISPVRRGRAVKVQRGKRTATAADRYLGQRA